MLDTVVTGAGAVALFVLGLFVRRFLPSYVSEKGKNLATREDVGEITRQIEAVRDQYARELELLRAALQSRKHVLEIRYEREFEILLELSAGVVRVRDAAMNLRPIVDGGPATEAEEDRRRRKLEPFQEAAQGLYEFAEVRRPFFPSQLYSAIHELLSVARSEAVQFAIKSSDEANLTQYWEEAERNSDRIVKLAIDAIEAIRERARVWELEDPGP